jgi:hypothetical protein
VFVNVSTRISKGSSKTFAEEMIMGLLLERGSSFSDEVEVVL